MIHKYYVTYCKVHELYRLDTHVRCTGGGHSLVWLARPYDLIAEDVKVGWSSIVIS